MVIVRAVFKSFAPYRVAFASNVFRCFAANPQPRKHRSKILPAAPPAVTTPMTTLRTLSLTPVTYGKDLLMMLYSQLDLYLSRRTPRLVKFMLKALTKLSSQVSFTPQELLLIGIILYRLQKQAEIRPPPELAAVQAHWHSLPDPVVTTEGALFCPPYAHPETDVHEILVLKRVLQCCLAAYAANDGEVTETLGIARKDILSSNWVADPDTLVPAYFVAVDDGLQAIVVSIRGTYSLSDTLVNFTVSPETLAGGTVHSGMYLTAEQLIHHLKTRIDFAEVFRKRPDYTLLLTGHSMGGAVAAIMAIMMKVDYPHTRARVVCPPSCMSHSLSQSCASYVSSYVNGDDVVPRFHYDSIQRLRAALESVDVQREVLQELHLDGIITPQRAAMALKPLEMAWHFIRGVSSKAWLLADILSIPVRSWSGAASAFYDHIRGVTEDLLIGQAHYLRSVRERLGADTADVIKAAEQKHEAAALSAASKPVWIISDAYDYAAAEQSHLDITATQAGVWKPHGVDEEFEKDYYLHKVRDFSGHTNNDVYPARPKYVHDAVMLAATSMHLRVPSKESRSPPQMGSGDYQQYDTDFVVEPGSIISDPADPYGLADDEEMDARDEFTVHPPSLFGKPAFFAPPIVSDDNSNEFQATQASGFDPETVQRQLQVPPTSEATPTAAEALARSLQYYPPGKIWYMAYPPDYSRRAHTVNSVAAMSGPLAREIRASHHLQQFEAEMASQAGADVIDDDEEDDEHDVHRFRRRLTDKRLQWSTIARDNFGTHHTQIISELAKQPLVEGWNEIKHYNGPVLVRLEHPHPTSFPKATPVGEITADADDPDSFEAPWPSLDNAVEGAKDEKSTLVNDDVSKVTRRMESLSPFETAIFDVNRYFGHVILSKNMFTDHLCSSFSMELDQWLLQLTHEQRMEAIIRGDRGAGSTNMESMALHSRKLGRR